MPWYCWRSPPGWSFVAMCPDPTSALFSGGTLTGAAAKHPSVGVQNVLISGRGAGYAVTFHPDMQKTGRCAFPQNLSISVMRSVGGYSAGGGRSRQLSTARCTLRGRAHGPGGPAGDRESRRRLGGRVCLEEGFYPHRQGPAGLSSRNTSGEVQGRSSVRSNPPRVSRPLSTETICGPKLRPPPRGAGRHRAGTGGLHRRRSMAVEVGFEPTEGLRLHTLSSTAHHRSPASASVRACANTIWAGPPVNGGGLG